MTVAAAAALAFKEPAEKPRSRWEAPAEEPLLPPPTDRLAIGFSTAAASSKDGEMVVLLGPAAASAEEKLRSWERARRPKEHLAVASTLSKRLGLADRLRLARGGLRDLDIALLAGGTQMGLPTF